MKSNNSTQKSLLLILFLLAFAVRLIYFCEIRQSPFYNHPIVDAAWHDQWAKTLAAGNWKPAEPFFRAPLYPYFLGVLYKTFSPGPAVPIIFQMALGALNCILIYLIARLLFPPLVATISYIVAVLYGTVIFFEGELLIPTLAIFLNISALYLLIRAFWGVKHPLAYWFSSGLLLGLSATARPNILLFVPCVFAWAVITGKRPQRRKENYIAAPSPQPSPTRGEGVIHTSNQESEPRQAPASRFRSVLLLLLVFSLGLLLPIAPVTVSNYLTSGEFILISWQGGVNFYMGNNPLSDGKSATLPGVKRKSWKVFLEESTRMAEDETGYRLTPAELSRFWFAKGISFIRSQPLAFVKLMLKKIYFFWHGYEIPNNKDFYFFRRYSSLLSILLWRYYIYFPFGLIAPLALTGVFLSRSYSRNLFLLYAFLFTYTVSVILFFVSARFRLPVIPITIIFASFTIYRIIEYFRQNRLKIFALLILLIFALGYFLNYPLFHLESPSYAETHLSLGNLFLEEGKYDQASEAYKAALNCNPFYTEAYFNLGLAYYKQGQLEKAVSFYEQSLVLNPDYAEAYYSLGVIYDQRGETGQAISNFQKAIDLNPDYLEARFNLGSIYSRRQESEKAINQFQAILMLAPQNSEAHFKLGYVYQINEQLEKAKEEYELALKFNPKRADAYLNLGSIYFDQGLLADCISHFQKAVTLSPQDASPHFNLALAYGRTGQLDKAREELEKTLALEPDFTRARQLLKQLSAAKQ